MSLQKNKFQQLVSVLPSRGGLEVERCSDNRTDSASVGVVTLRLDFIRMVTEVVTLLLIT